MHAPSGLPFLRLADGACWRLESADEGGRRLVARLSRHMRLGVSPCGKVTVLNIGIRAAGDPPSPADEGLAPGVHISPAAGDVSTLICRVNPFVDEEDFLTRLMALSHVFSRAAEKRGGLLLHGALVAHGGDGVILSGPSGVGKTTAAHRIPPPWRALSDDAALIVRANDGSCRAHPWPTWSRLFEGQTRRSWPVSENVRLAGIFLLARAGPENPQTLHPARAAMELLKRGYDCSWDVFRGRKPEDVRGIRLELFRNACDLARDVPVRSLRVTLHNPFWRSIERVANLRPESRT